MAEPDKNATEPELRARLDSLSTALERVAKADKAEAKAASDDKALSGAMSVGFRAAADLTGGVIAGALIGYLADRLFGTSPFLLIAFLAIGIVAGFRSVYRLGARPTGRARDASQD